MLRKTKSQPRRRHTTDSRLPHDSVVPDSVNSDIIIVVMGATGTGKSTFVNSLIGSDEARVGHGLRSQTSTVQHYVFTHPHHLDRRILIVDTPGSNATDTSDTEILNRITAWLARSYESGMKLAGIVYLHDISHKRMEGSKRINYEVFEKLCGKEGATKVVLATTMWSEVNEREGEAREKQLKDDFWSDMFSRGSTIHRVHPTKDSVLDVVNSVLSQSFTKGVAIQREIVDERKKLTETEAYHHLRKSKTFELQTAGERENSCWRFFC